jgi:hypothetical protein
MARKIGDDSFGNTELLSTISLDELKIIERIAKALANDGSGKLLGVFKANVGFWEQSAQAVPEVVARAREMATRASKAKHPKGAVRPRLSDRSRRHVT